MLKYWLGTLAVLLLAALTSVSVGLWTGWFTRTSIDPDWNKTTTMYMTNGTANMVLQTTLMFLGAVPRPDQSAPDSTNEVDELTTSRQATAPCYAPYGCFSIAPPWTMDNAPAPFYPEAPAKVNTQFCLKTRLLPDSCQFLHPLNETSLYMSHLDAQARTVFIIHGYLESRRREWIKRMSAELLKHSAVNVVVVDWGGGSGPPYAQAVANIRLVGAMLSQLILLMTSHLGMSARNMHVIGHSLGAHTAAYVGSNLQKHSKRHKLARITGLDAAEPRFTGGHPLIRLDPTDADFVDAIHTDAAPFIAGGLGIREPVGHVDFYPNGGRDQPGCADSMSNYITEKGGNVLRGLEKFLNCNHVRSNDFFVESINSKCGFWAVQCHSWEAYKNGSCFSCAGHHSSQRIHRNGLGPRCARMGMHAQGTVDPSHLRPNRAMKLYLMTGARTPFCREQYRVTLNVSSTHASVTHGGEVGVFSIVIMGTAGTTQRLELNNREMFYEPGSVHSHVITGGHVGVMTAAILSWDYRTSLFNPLTWRLLVMPRIHVASVTVDSLEERDSMTLSPPDGMPVVTNKALECHRSAPGECRVKLISTTM